MKKTPAAKRPAVKTASKTTGKVASKTVSKTTGKVAKKKALKTAQKVSRKVAQKVIPRPAKQKPVKQSVKQPVKRVAVAAKAPAIVAAPIRKVAASARQSKAVAAKAATASIANEVLKVVEGALDEMKAVQVKVLDVRKLTDIADTLVIASGNSDRHVRSIADRVLEHARKAGFRPTGVEGQRDGEWVLVDLQDVIVHIMLPRVREIYRLENLWDVSAARREAAMEKMAV